MMDDNVQVRLVARDGSEQLDITEHCLWEFSSIRSGIAESFVDVDAELSALTRFGLWCDFVEVTQGENLLCRHIIRSFEPQKDWRIRIAGLGLVAQLNRRRHDFTGAPYSGFSTQVAQKLFNDADAVEALKLAVYVTGDVGKPISVPVNAGASMFETFEALADVHCVISEHGGVCYVRAIDDEEVGPSIRSHWLADPSALPPGLDGNAVINEVAIAYGPQVEQFITWPPEGLADPNRSGCRLQAGVIEYPEILDQDTAYATAKEAHSKLTYPNVVLTGQLLAPGKVDFAWLVPGRSQVSMLPGSERAVCNLAQVDVRGYGDKCTEIEANWDQADAGALRKLVEARA